MKITSAEFVASVLGTNDILEHDEPQIVLMGRSNVGKSSVINSLVDSKDLARTSTIPGSTQQMNIYRINNKIYLVDLPGYGYAKASWKERERIQTMISWYLLESHYKQKKVILIIDANVGPKDMDIEALEMLEKAGKEILVVANKIDKIKKSELNEQLKKIETTLGRPVLPYSAKENIGVGKLVDEILL